MILDEESEEEVAVEPEEPDLEIFHPSIESIHATRLLEGEKEYYVKLSDRSFLHCEWRKEKELLEYDSNIKHKIGRFNKQYLAEQLKGKGDVMLNFDTHFLEVERVLECSEMFPVMHIKKAAEMRDKWSEKLVKVLRYLINFQIDKVNYGIYFLNLDPEMTEIEGIHNRLDFSIILNKLYLDVFKRPVDFWRELVELFSIFNKLNRDKKNDIGCIIHRLMQVSKVLYKEWEGLHQKEIDELIEFNKRNFSFNKFKTLQEELFKISNKDNTQTNMNKTFIELKMLIKNNEEFIEGSTVLREKMDEMKEIVEKSKPLLVVTENKPIITNEEVRPVNDCIDDNMVIEPIQKEEQPIQEQINTNNDLDKLFQSFIDLLNQIQIEFNQHLLKFENLFSRQAKASIHNIYEPIRTSLGWLNNSSEPDLSFLTDKDIIISIEHPHETLYCVKWKHLSYSDTTWEKKSDIEGFAEEIKDFIRFNKSLDRNTRKLYTIKYDAHKRLDELISNKKKFAKINSAIVTEYKKKLFKYKEYRRLFQYNPEKPPIYKEGRRLRSYQLESVNWMINSWTKRTNVILADEMGLGKTIQAMSFVNYLIDIENQIGPYLVLAPLSTLQHWLRVFKDWSNLNCILYYDSNGKNGRADCREWEWYRQDITMKGITTKTSRICKFNVLITSFEVFLQDFEGVFKDLPFQHIIIDEAHRLKNKNAKIITVLNQLVCKRILLLTGTPIQNNMSELWSLLHFIEPFRFSDLEEFERQFGNLANMDQLEKLKQTLKPFLLRRMKEDVESSIPPLQETIIDIELTKLQKIVYKTIYEKNKGTLQKGLGLQYVSQMNNLEMQLRKCCNHPFLLQDIKENLVEDCKTMDKYHDKLLATSGKMILVDKMIQKYRKENKKILIFSQFTEMLNVIEEYLTYHIIPYEKIDGSTKAKDRQVSIDRFNRKAAEFGVFLLSTKAGGIGINLTSAKIVIIYDSDWNPQNDVQAIARAHRIGQTEEVKVFRLISKKTYEVEMFERASKKLGLDQAVFLTSNFDTKTDDKMKQEDMTKLNPKEIELLLRKGMVGLLNEEREEDKEAEQFNMNLDEIVKNARVANYSFIKGTYTFAKTNFNSNKQDAKYQIDDPDFWKKVFANSDNPAGKITKKYMTMVENGTIKILDVQKKLFLELSSEIYKYLENRVKSEGFCADTENTFVDLLEKIVCNQYINKSIKELLEQLSIDFEKKSRRIKKIDEKQLNAILKRTLRRRDTTAKKKIVDELKTVKTKKIKKTDDKVERMTTRRSRKEEQQPKLQFKKEDTPNEIFEDESSDFKISMKKPKKPKGKVRNYCDICGKNNFKLHCEGHCDLNFHESCLEDLVLRDTMELNCYLTSNRKKAKKQFVPMNASICIYCNYKVAFCFKCRKLGEIELSNKTSKSIKNTGKLMNCKKCPRFFHHNCFVIGAEQDSDNLMCNSHFCGSCNEYSDKLNVCIKCPIGFHKKCMSKRNKIIKGNRIICYLHTGSKEKVRESSEDKNLYKCALKIKRNQISEESEESKGKKKVKTETEYLTDKNTIIAQVNVS